MRKSDGGGWKGFVHRRVGIFGGVFIIVRPSVRPFQCFTLIYLIINGSLLVDVVHTLPTWLWTISKVMAPPVTTTQLHPPFFNLSLCKWLSAGSNSGPSGLWWNDASFFFFLLGCFPRLLFNWSERLVK